MKLIIDSNYINIEIMEDAVYVKYSEGNYIECNEDEATGIYSKIKNVIFLIDINNRLYIIDNVSNIPDDWVSNKYKYIDGEFVLNPDYKEPPLSQEELSERLQLIEEAFNELVMNGGV